MSSICDICAHNYTKKTRPQIKCTGCENVACLSCCSKYILEYTADSPSCMFQHCQWSDDFLKSHFSTKFMKDLINKQKDIWFEQEKSKIPSMINHVEAYTQCRLMDESIKQLKIQKASLTHQIRIINYQHYELSSSRQSLMKNIISPKQRYKDLFNSVVLKCPVVNCDGYLNNSTMKCTLCNEIICRECHQPLKFNDDGNTHTCQQSDIDSIKYVTNNSKPCPKCSTRISKIDGCDQMWCVNPSCQTSFSWRTGQLSTERVHNPEYYRFMRENNNRLLPEDDRVLQCGREGYTAIKWLTTYNRVSSCNDLSRLAIHTQSIVSMHRCSGHIAGMITNLDRSIHILQNKNTNIDFIQYILKETSETTFRNKTTVHRIKMKKCREYINILNSIQLVFDESLIYLSELKISETLTCLRHKQENDKNIKYEQTHVDTIKNTLDRCREACTYANTQLYSISKRYNTQLCVIPLNFATKTIAVRV